jgi:hypothetical protein
MALEERRGRWRATVRATTGGDNKKSWRKRREKVK